MIVPLDKSLSIVNNISLKPYKKGDNKIFKSQNLIVFAESLKPYQDCRKNLSKLNGRGNMFVENVTIQRVKYAKILRELAIFETVPNPLCQLLNSIK
jgi:hypothetical protein